MAHGTHGRAGDAGHHVVVDGKTGETLRSPTVPTQLQPRAEPAARDPDRVFGTLAHLIDEALLREAYRHTRTSSAAGIDGVTAPPYAEHLDDHLRDLPERLRSERSQAAPVERVWMEQEDGRQRPIGTPTCEEKMGQRAVAMRLEALDEHDVSDGSDGFRPGRSPHDALHALRERGMTEGLGWIVDADIRGDVDRIDRTHLRDVLRTRGNAGGRWRLIGPWRRAGVMEEGVRSHPETGGVQGGGISPVLATICLHHGLDAWCEREGRRRMQGRCFLIRCADDGVIGCALAADARTIMAVLPKRLGRFGLTIPPTKTALVSCRKPNGHKPAGMEHGTGDFLGGPHDWPQSRPGSWVSKRRTARQRLRHTKQALWRWGRTHRHAPVKDQYQRRSLKLRGPFQDDGMRGKCRLLEVIHH